MKYDKLNKSTPSAIPEAENEQYAQVPSRSLHTLEIEEEKPRSPVRKFRISPKNITSKMNCCPSLLFLLLIIGLSLQYVTSYEVCPHDTDYQCYHRYLLCEGDCSGGKLYYEDTTILGFTSEPRTDDNYLKTQLAWIIFTLLVVSAGYSFILTYAIIDESERGWIFVVATNLVVLRFYRSGKIYGDYTSIIGNRLLLLVFLFTLLFTIIAISIQYCAKGRKYAWRVFGGFVLVFALIALSLVHRYKNSCSKWDVGLYGERMDNITDCKFNAPGFCLAEFIGEVEDYNKWVGYTCEDKVPNFKFMNYRYPNSDRVGFPIMTKLSNVDRQPANVAKYVLAHLTPVTNLNKDQFEVILHRPKEDDGSLGTSPYFEINVHYDAQVVEERTKKQTRSLASHVMVIHIDALSRAAAHRQLPETMKAFENMTSKTYEFFKYHSIATEPAKTIYPMFYGISEPYLPFPPPGLGYSFVDEYKNKGFITGRALNKCQFSGFDDTYDPAGYKNIDEAPFDHMGNSWACDLNALPKIADEPDAEVLPLLRRCLYGKDISEYVLQYGKKFWHTYKREKKLLWLDFIDFHESTYNQGNYLDHHLAKFLNEMDLSNAVVILVSDHGQHVYKYTPFSNYQSTIIETANPIFLINLPPVMETEYGANLQKNKQRLIRAWDINFLLLSIPNPNLLGLTPLVPMQEKFVSCNFPMWGQNCQCQLVNNRQTVYLSTVLFAAKVIDGSNEHYLKFNLWKASRVQLWEETYTGKHYLFRNKKTNNWLNVIKEGDVFVPTSSNNYDGSDKFMWDIIFDANGSFRLKSVSANLYLDINNQFGDATIGLSRLSGSQTQLFRHTSVDI